MQPGLHLVNRVGKLHQRANWLSPSSFGQERANPHLAWASTRKERRVSAVNLRCCSVHPGSQEDHALTSTF